MRNSVLVWFLPATHTWHCSAGILFSQNGTDPVSELRTPPSMHALGNTFTEPLFGLVLLNYLRDRDDAEQMLVLSGFKP